jgi:radical S-adenosyl methionine domain-containing protein 2
LYPKFLGELVVYCKKDLKLESVSIISNGSLIKENWMNKYSPYLDILGISCDSFVEETNIKIGRGKGKHIENIFAVRQLCYKYNIKFKLNTVVCRYNIQEDMNECIARLDPFRWKCFQVLIVKTENDGKDDSKRNARDFQITDDEYEMFIKRHEDQKSLIKESNSIMKSSYLILDEYMRFLDKGDEDEYIISESILDVDVDKALSQINWDIESFEQRQGEYDWSNEFSTFTTTCGEDKSLDW